MFISLCSLYVYTRKIFKRSNKKHIYIYIYVYIFKSSAQQSCVPATAPRNYVTKQQYDGASKQQLNNRRDPWTRVPMDPWGPIAPC